MFLSLLIVTFSIAIFVSFLVTRLFNTSISAILNRIISEELATAWKRYIVFAIYVVGISGGVRIHQLERYITSRMRDDSPLILTSERWTLEVYRTVIETLQSIAWMLLIFFIFALIAYVVLRGFEMKNRNSSK